MPEYCYLNYASALLSLGLSSLESFGEAQCPLTQLWISSGLHTVWEGRLELSHMTWSKVPAPCGWVSWLMLWKDGWQRTLQCKEMVMYLLRCHHIWTGILSLYCAAWRAIYQVFASRNFRTIFSDLKCSLKWSLKPKHLDINSNETLHRWWFASIAGSWGQGMKGWRGCS